MTKGFKYLPLIFSFLLARSYAQVLWQFNKDTVITWYYSDGDEFNSDRVDTDKWKYSYNGSHSIASNKEQQYYSEGGNHQLNKGTLSLFAKREAVNKRLIDYKEDQDSIIHQGRFIGQNKRDFSFTSGMLMSRKKYQYGYFEIKFKAPAEKGFWPAFWLYGAPPYEEIDFMELKTESENKIHVGRQSSKREENYLRDGLRKRAWGGWVKFEGDLSAGYNVISGEWANDHITYYLNGEVIAYTALSLSVPKELAVNLAVPGNDGPFKPGPADEVYHSGNFEIDYIRIWDRAQTGRKPGERPDVSESRPISQTRLKTKKKFVYGKRSQHKNQGVFVSLFATGDNVYQVTVLGREVPEGLSYTLMDTRDERIGSGTLKYGETVIDLSQSSSEVRRIQVDIGGQSGSYILR